MNSKQRILVHQKVSSWLSRTSYGLFHDFRVEIHYSLIHYFMFHLPSTTQSKIWSDSMIAVSDLVGYLHFRLGPLVTLWICST